MKSDETVAREALRVRLWDAPTRLVHWALVLLVGGAWLTAETGQLMWHRYCGYTTLGLLVFRLFWGVFGASTARFSSFVKGPGAVAAYLKGMSKPGSAALPGHNPLGAYSVVAMILLLMTQVGLGLFAVDDDTGFEGGPLSQYVSYELGSTLADWHAVTFNILLALIGLHVAAVLFYLVVKRENLIAAMISGRRLMDSEPETIRFAPRWMALAGALVAVAVTYVLVKGGRL